ncbi:hypothetical protein QOT17_001640 [Balamuthia mandrillaris]
MVSMLAIRYIVGLSLAVSLFNAFSLISLHFVFLSHPSRPQEQRFIEPPPAILSPLSALIPSTTFETSIPLTSRSEPLYFDKEIEQQRPTRAEISRQTMKTWQSRTEEQWKEEFWEEGAIGPFHLLDEEERLAVRAELNSVFKSEKGFPWPKSKFFTSTLLVSFGMHPVFLHQIRTLLGEDLLLYGIYLVEKNGGEPHRWHLDVDSWKCESSATVWLGLQEVTPENALMVISRTHRWKSPIVPQEFEPVPNVTDGGRLAHENLLREARNADMDAQLLKFDVFDGDYFIFHGQIWHGSGNPKVDARQAVIVQFVHAECAIRQTIQFKPPYGQEATLPPVLLVSGTANDSSNKSNLNHLLLLDPDSTTIAPFSTFLRPHLQLRHQYVEVELKPPPNATELANLTLLDGAAFFGAIPLYKERQLPVRSFRFLHHQTPVLDFLEAHLTIQKTFNTPHPPHSHHNEEIFVVLDGELRLTVLPNRRDYGSPLGGPLPEDLPEEILVKSGDVVFMPANTLHSITALSFPQASYLCVTYHSSSSAAERRRGTTFFPAVVIKRQSPSKWKRVESLRTYNATLGTGRVFFNQTTSMLTRVVGRTATLPPKGKFEPQKAPQEVLVVVEKGSIGHLTRGKRLNEGDVAYIPGGALRGFRNVSNRGGAQYLVFEFHP